MHKFTVYCANCNKELPIRNKDSIKDRTAISVDALKCECSRFIDCGIDQHERKVSVRSELVASYCVDLYAEIDQLKAKLDEKRHSQKG